MNENFRNGFEKVAINLGTIQRAINNTARRIGIDVSDPLAKTVEGFTNKFIHFSKDNRKILLNNVSKMQNLKRLSKQYFKK